MTTSISGVANKIKNLTQALLGKAGYEVFKKDTSVPLVRRKATIAELEILYRKFVFPELSVCEGRADLMAELVGTSSSEAIYLVEYLRRSLAVEGDVCEFGVAQGATSALLGNEIRATAKSLWLFDSFEGLPRPTAKDVLLNDIFNLGSIEKYQGTMACEQTQVLRRLRRIRFPSERVNLVPGFIEKTIRNPALPSKVCFAYVDFDFYEPIKTALEYLHGVLPVGGHVVVDDYGWFSAGAQAAVDEFVARHPADYERITPIEGVGHFVVLARKAVARKAVDR